MREKGLGGDLVLGGRLGREGVESCRGRGAACPAAFLAPCSLLHVEMRNVVNCFRACSHKSNSGLLQTASTC